MSDVIVLVSTFDQYADTWNPWCHGFRKYWPGCPWPVVFVTNELDPPCGNAVKVGIEKNWSETTHLALGQIDVPVVLKILEDQWLYAPVDVGALCDFAAIVLDGGANHIRLCPTGQGAASAFERDQRLFVLANAPYKVSNQASFWRVETLKSLLVPGETSGDFEWYGSMRAFGQPGFLCVRQFGCLPYVHPTSPDWAQEAVHRGYWTDAAKEYAWREGLEIDFTKHPNPDGYWSKG